jgi:HSP20 family protein
MATGTALAPEKRLRKFATMDPFSRLFERLNTFAPFEGNVPLSTWAPACDIYETDKDLVLKVEIPGIKKEDVKVSLENNVLMIHGERKFEEETKRENYHRVERDYGEFLRSFTLPPFIEPDKIFAEFKDGLLTVMLPKREEAKPKLIEVKVK